MSTSHCTVSPQPGATPENARSHHIKDKNGRIIRFENPFLSYGPNAWLPQIWLKLFRTRVQGDLPTPDTSNLHIPIVPPIFLPLGTVCSSLRTTWIGHASCFVEFPSGFRALFDPVFEDRCISIGPKRFTPPACNIADFPVVDAVFISHNHSDHLSYPTVKGIVGSYPHVQFFVGLGVAKWFHDSGINAVTEMDWWDDAEVVLKRTTRSNTGSEVIERITALVSCLPTQHGSLRTLFDRDRTLWASWAIKSGTKSVWFAGDTGYRYLPEGVEELGPGFGELPRNPQFVQIGDLRGPFDLGLIPIGGYQPRSVWSPIHASPYDAVEIFQDTRCSKALGIHWGAWPLTCEPPEQPPEKLKEALKIKGLPQTGLFDSCAIGESREF